MSRFPLSQLFDRTAVLAVGVVAGFAIGLSFNAAGREAVAGWFFGGAAAPVAVTHATPVAAAVGTPELAGPVDARVVARVRGDGHIRVGVFGDSFGDGIWAALYHHLPPKQNFDVFRFSKEATGFTRYRQIDLDARAHEQVRTQPIDVAVISFGANDVQPIFAEGHLQLLMSDGWKRIIGERIDRFVATVRGTGATVYWVGLPIVRDPAMDGQIRNMMAFYADRMRALHVPFLDTRPASLDASGHYNDHLIDGHTGEPRLMRGPDGLHMTGIGYQRITADLADRIRRYAVLARRQAGVPAPQPTPTPTPKPRPSPSATPSADATHRETERANRDERRTERRDRAATGSSRTGREPRRDEAER